MSNVGLIIIGDEILSGRRQDKHLAKCVELLSARGMQLAYAHYVGDDRDRIAATLKAAFASGDVVFSTGGIGATPDDHTRQAAAAALGQRLVVHPEAKRLIEERMADIAREQGTAFAPTSPDNLHRLNMGMFPETAQIIPNPYNKIAGFSVGTVHFVPGFPVMAWPMIEWVLDTHYPHLHQLAKTVELSVIVAGAAEATLTPLMEAIEREHNGVKVFSLPSVDHPVHGRHIDLGVKGVEAEAEVAFTALLAGLKSLGAAMGETSRR
jgi:molybdopterin-biosynthesis enzyme MoeA-like protein